MNASAIPPISPSVTEALAPYWPVAVMQVTSDRVLGQHHLRPGDQVILSPKKVPQSGGLIALFMKGWDAPRIGVLARDLPRYHKEPDPDTGGFSPVQVDYTDGYGIRHYGGSPLDYVMGCVAIVRPVI